MNRRSFLESLLAAAAVAYAPSMPAGQASSARAASRLPDAFSVTWWLEDAAGREMTARQRVEVQRRGPAEWSTSSVFTTAAVLRSGTFTTLVFDMGQGRVVKRAVTADVYDEETEVLMTSLAAIQGGQVGFTNILYRDDVDK